MSDQLTSSQVSESKPVRVLGAVAAMSVAAPSALAVIPGVPGWVAAAVGAFGLLLTIGLAKYTGDVTAPWKDVAAKVTPSGKVIAGPAARQPTGSAVVVKTDTVSPKFETGGSVYPADRLPENQDPEAFEGGPL